MLDMIGNTCVGSFVGVGIFVLCHADKSEFWPFSWGIMAVGFGLAWLTMEAKER